MSCETAQQRCSGLSGLSVRHAASRAFAGWVIPACILFCAVGGPAAAASDALGPGDLLILVNNNSPVSRSIADMYRRYYPDVASWQVLGLDGLRDSADRSSTPSDEIITRSEFESKIATPVRTYLVSTGLVNSIYCIVTTAGMPYRIEDSDQSHYADAVTPAGSNATLVQNNRTAITAASVESELALLFQIDPALTPGPSGPGAPVANRIVNPYHGYRSGIKSWSGIRDICSRRTTMHWNFSNLWSVSQQPRIEGTYDSNGCSSRTRIMSPADIYLVARLDGPHVTGAYPIFAVRDMLDRSAAVSNPAFPEFEGYNGEKSVLVVDSTPPPFSELSYTPAYNYPAGTTFLSFDANPVPPGRENYAMPCQRGTANHYDTLFTWLTGAAPSAGASLIQPILPPFSGSLLWDDSSAVMHGGQTVFPAGKGVIGLATYGCNGGDGRPATYLLTGGPGGGPLCRCVPGAVFTSVESFNAVTMFIDTATTQAKIADFIQMGGTAAIGHALEPGQDALVQVEYLFGNLLRDDDGDGVGDLCLAEAAFTSLPYLSWTEVLIGDPLMRLHAGQGGLVKPPCPADANSDGFVGYYDRMLVLIGYNNPIGEARYDPAADIDHDGFIGYYDHMAVLTGYNKTCPDN